MRLPWVCHIISPPNAEGLPATASQPLCRQYFLILVPNYTLLPARSSGLRVSLRKSVHVFIGDVLPNGPPLKVQLPTEGGPVIRLTAGVFAELSIRTHVISIIISHCSTLLLLGGSISIYFNPRIHFTVDVLTWLSTYCFWGSNLTQLISPPSHDWECGSINVELLSSWSSGL